ncbi:LPS ABC transporter [Candidatus Saccharibacteria bacterium]|nr:MAG: LPS ABC transporter [Candidatus Saccharibacteria bacterium]PID99205.1 MAG: LPS ABC transporter [Candidatus Saccharibacteria bacterium]
MGLKVTFQKAFSKKNRALLAELVRTDFKLRYQGSVLGYAWSLLRPMLMFAILYVVFVKFLRIGGDIPHYPIYLLFGIVLWIFFADTTAQSLGSIVVRGDLIRKIKIPRWMIVFSSTIGALINLGFNLIVIALLMLLSKAVPMDTFYLLPLYLVEIYIFGLGLSLFLSAAFVKYRDIGYIWEVCLQAGFYLTPILYPLALVANVTFQKLLLLSPMAQAIQDARYAIVSHDDKVITTWKIFDGGWYAFIPLLIVFSMFVLGLMYFKSQSASFAENL